MFRVFKELLSSFNAHHVKYLVVGGYAVSFHAQPRSTKDLDLFLKADETNARAAFAELASFGVSLTGITIEDFANQGNSFGSATNRSPSTFFRALMALISKRRGRGASRGQSTVRPASRRFLFLSPTSSLRNWRLAGCAILPTSRKFERPRTLAFRLLDPRSGDVSVHPRFQDIQGDRAAAQDQIVEFADSKFRAKLPLRFRPQLPNF